MDHLKEVTVEALQDALDTVEGEKPTQRLLAAIAYKHGVTQTELAEWYGVERKTIYNWLTRFEGGVSEDTLKDAERPGRPRRLSEATFQEFERTLHDSPATVGYDEPTWTPELVRRHLEETYDVVYSTPSCRRLMKEVGMSFQPVHSDPSTDSDSTDAGRNRSRGRWAFDRRRERHREQ